MNCMAHLAEVRKSTARLVIVAIFAVGGCDRPGNGEGAGAAGSSDDDVAGQARTKGDRREASRWAALREKAQTAKGLREILEQAGQDRTARASSIAEIADRLGPKGSVDGLRTFRANLAEAGASEEELQIGSSRYLHRWSEERPVEVWNELRELVDEGERWIGSGLNMAMRGYILEVGVESATAELRRLEAIDGFPRRIVSDLRADVAAESILRGSSSGDSLALLSKRERFSAVSTVARSIGARFLSGELVADQFSDVVESLTDPGLRADVLGNAIREVGKERKPAPLIELLRHARQHGLDDVSSLAALELADVDPTAAAEWFGGIGQVPAPVLDRIANARTAASPSEAFDWVLRISDPDQRARGLSVVIAEWSSLDARAAAASVGELPPGVDRDVAATGLVRFLHRKGAHEEAKEWLGLVGDPAHRTTLERELGY